MSARPRVTIVAHDVHDDGGMEAAVAHLIRFAHTEFDFTVITGRLADDLRPLVRWRRVRVVEKPAIVRFLAFGIWAGVTLRCTEPADIVHTLGALIPNRADLASIHYCHAAVPLGARTTGHDVGLARGIHAQAVHWVSLLAERWCYRPSRLRRAAAVSRGVADEFTAAYPGISVSITPNGVDVERFAPDASVREEVRAEAGAGPDDVVVLFVGGDWNRKGLAIAIAAVGRLVKDGAPLCLWVVGRGDANRYRALASMLIAWLP
jgi:glycosyltransferase involved in cell wall biosynthesis